MVQVIKRATGKNIYKSLRQFKEAENYTRKSFMETNEFQEVVSSLYQKGYSEDEIIQIIFDTAKANGIEEGLKYSQKEIRAVLKKASLAKTGETVKIENDVEQKEANEFTKEEKE